MRIYVPAVEWAGVERYLATGKRPYTRKLPTSGQDYDRLRKAEKRRRLRLLARPR